MRRWLGHALLSACLGGCALWHTSPDDAAVATDGATDAQVDPADAGVPTHAGGHLGGSDGLVCGPNRCRTAEVCCDDRCGICAVEGECPSFDCPDPARP